MKKHIALFAAGLAAALCLLTRMAAGSDAGLEKLWVVGKPDAGYMEFSPLAASAAMNGYASRFGDDFKIKAGLKSKSGDFPGLQAGPAAAWGAYRQYPIRILFEIPAPAPGGYVLTVDLCGAAPDTAGELLAQINQSAQTASVSPGGSNQVLDFPQGFADPQTLRFFFAPGAVQPGKNVLSLTLTRGAWVVYDAMRLDAVAGAAQTLALDFEVDAPPFLAHSPDGPGHPVRASFFAVGPAAHAILSVEVAGKQITAPVKISGGQTLAEIVAPEQSAETQAVVRLDSQGRTLAQAAVTLRPVRHFSITIVPHSHLDIGYPDQQPNIMIGQKMYLERALDLIEQDAGAPMAWVAEASWPVERNLKGMGPFEEYGDFLNESEAVLMKTVTPQFLKDTMRMHNAAMGAAVTSSAGGNEEFNSRRAVDGSPQGWNSRGPARGAWIALAFDNPQPLRYVALRGGREAENRITKVKLSYTFPDGKTESREAGPMGATRERLLLDPPAQSVAALRVDILDADQPDQPASLMEVEAWAPQDPEQLRTRIIKAAQSGRLEVTGMYMNFLTQLAPTEWLIRSFQGSQDVALATGAPLRTAMMTDVPGFSWAMPDVLSGMGIRYFYPALNPDRAHNCLLGIPSAFWWKGPSGGRVLVFRAFNTYNEGWWLGLGESVDIAEKKLPGLLATLDEKTYPYDMLMLRMLGDITDDGPVAERLPRIVSEWNRRWAWPRLTIGTPTPFFEAFEKQYGGALPLLEGDWTSYWEDGEGSSAQETALARTLHRDLLGATALYAIKRRISGPDPDIEANLAVAEEGLYLYDEHTWGADQSVREPDSPRTLGQWMFKRLPLLRARDKTRLAMQALAPLSNEPAAAVESVQDRSLNSGAAMDNGYYKIVIDAQTGRITSILDKRNGRELVDSAQGFGMNELLYVEERNNQAPVRLSNVSVAPGGNTADYSETIITGNTPMLTSVEQTVRLYHNKNLITFTNRFHKKKTYSREALYFAFPLNVPGGALRLDMTGGVMQVETDQLPAGSRDWISMQDAAAAVGADYSILFAAPDAPLVVPEALMVNTFQKKLPRASAALFSYPLNNYWHTNYLAGQGGDFLFRYAIAGVPEHVADSQIVRFGMDQSADPMAAFTAPGQGVAGRFLSVSPATVRVLGVKPAAQGRGIVVRVQEMDGAETDVAVTAAAALNITKASVTDLLEQPLGEARVVSDDLGNAIITGHMGPHGYLTLLLE